MYSGWLVRFRINRVMTPREQGGRLQRTKLTAYEPDPHGALIGFNSTYAEFLDRSFRFRGKLEVLIVVLFQLYALGIVGCFWIMLPSKGSAYLIANVTLSTGMFLMVWGVWRMYPSKDFFVYTHYPIRYNRRTRQIYVFRHNGPGGVLTVPWDSAYFHIGEGIRDKSVLDLRCHVLDGLTVKQTFATGHAAKDSDQVVRMWEFIRTYMDEGPAALEVLPITASTSTSLYNCWIMGNIMMGVFSRMTMVLMVPFTGPTTLTRWLVMKTCKRPVWPAEVEAACEIDADDPFRLPEPSYIAEFEMQDEVLYDRVAERYTKLGKTNPRPLPPLWPSKPAKIHSTQRFASRGHSKKKSHD